MWTKWFLSSALNSALCTLSSFRYLKKRNFLPLLSMRNGVRVRICLPMKNHRHMNCVVRPQRQRLCDAMKMIWLNLIFLSFRLLSRLSCTKTGLLQYVCIVHNTLMCCACISITYHQHWWRTYHYHYRRVYMRTSSSSVTKHSTYCGCLLQLTIATIATCRWVLLVWVWWERERPNTKDFVFLLLLLTSSFVLDDVYSQLFKWWRMIVQL